MKRILITGVNGFVGQHAACEFLDRFAGKARIFGAGRSIRPNSLPNGIEYTPVNLDDFDAILALLSNINPTDILHLAAQSSVSGASDNPLSAWEGNVANLIQFTKGIVRKSPTANVYFASSGDVYGRAFLSDQPVRESVLPDPVSIYAKTKLVGEGILRDGLGDAHGGRLAILRPFNHIGPGQDERFVIASFAVQIARIEAGLTRPVLEVGDLSAQRDFLHVRDVVGAYADLIEAADLLDRVCVYNICSGQSRTIASLLAELQAMSRVKFAIRVDPNRLRPSEIPVTAGDASAIADAVGWKPRWSLRETLASILNQARANVNAVGVAPTTR